MVQADDCEWSQNETATAVDPWWDEYHTVMSHRTRRVSLA